MKSSTENKDVEGPVLLMDNLTHWVPSSYKVSASFTVYAPKIILQSFQTVSL